MIKELFQKLFHHPIKMVNLQLQKPVDYLNHLKTIVEDDGTLTVVDGASYYEGCGVGGYFYYKDDTCFEISKEVFNYCKSEINFKVITANQKHGDHFPIKCEQTVKLRDVRGEFIFNGQPCKIAGDDGYRFVVLAENGQMNIVDPDEEVTIRIKKA